MTTTTNLIELIDEYGEANGKPFSVRVEARVKLLAEARILEAALEAQAKQIEALQAKLSAIEKGAAN